MCASNGVYLNIMRLRPVEYEDLASDLLVLNSESANANSISVNNEWENWYSVKYYEDSVSPNVMAVASYFISLLSSVSHDSDAIAHKAETIMSDNEATTQYSEQIIAISSLAALSNLVRNSPIAQGEGLEFSDDALKSTGAKHLLDT